MAKVLRHPAWSSSALDQALQHQARAAAREARTREPEQVQSMDLAGEGEKPGLLAPRKRAWRDEEIP